MALLSLRGVGLSFGGPRLLDGADLQIERGERVCLLGRNGEGKTSLMRLIQGEIVPDDGLVERQQGLRVALLPQDVPEGLGGSVADEVARGLSPSERRAEATDHRVERVLSQIGLDGELRFADLSSGMKRRAMLARALVNEPDILLLDEPTNHLDIDSIRWLENYLLRYGGTLVFVTHDRAFLERLATRIVEIDRGKLYDWACDYPTFLKRREEVLHAEERQQALFDKRLAQEEVWIRKGIQARRTRNEGRVRALKALREMRSQRRERQGSAKMQLQEADRSGTRVVEAKGVMFGYDDVPVIRDLTTTISRGDKVGIIGPNGSGKSTLLKLLLGELAPQSGTIRHGTKLEVAYFDQTKAALDDEATVQQNISAYDTIPINGQPKHILSYLQDFLFPPERSRSLVKFLSGGERSRLLLARLFTKPSNVLVLDEPTNDLDMETLDLLEGLLVEYQGTVLVVSHDRAFLDDVATSILSVEPDGEVREYDGGYGDFLRASQERISTQAKASPTATAGPSNSASADRARKLTFKEKKELAALPGQIEALEASIAEAHEAMADPSFYKRDKAEIQAASAEVSASEDRLAEAYARWEELAALGE
jgi:ABC transport system ATP-binding/permease protein